MSCGTIQNINQTLLSSGCVGLLVKRRSIGEGWCIVNICGNLLEVSGVPSMATFSLG